MGSHPINLIIRFFLEIAALIASGLWGWNWADAGFHQYLLATGIPISMAIIWGAFAVPDDPSRSSKTLVATPGIIRLLIELFFFAFASWSLYDLEYINLSAVFTSLVILHYIFSYDRIRWLLSR